MNNQDLNYAAQNNYYYRYCAINKTLFSMYKWQIQYKKKQSKISKTTIANHFQNWQNLPAARYKKANMRFFFNYFASRQLSFDVGSSNCALNDTQHVLSLCYVNESLFGTTWKWGFCHHATNILYDIMSKRDVFMVMERIQVKDALLYWTHSLPKV